MTEKIACKYCQKTFRRATTLSAHLCESKRRHQQEKDRGVQLGFHAYLRFYELTQGSAKLKTYTDFASSPYYSAFVKFGQFMVSIRAINPPAFTEWMIKQNKKLDQWTKDKFYDEYLFEYIRREHPKDALERSLTEMQIWADECGGQFNQIFTHSAPNKVVQMVTNGRISAWVIYNCASGVEFLGKMNPEQLTMMFNYIDPDFWQKKFKDYVSDTEWTKMILREAGL